MSEIPSEQIVDQFVGASHGDFPTFKRLLEEYPLLVNMPSTWGEYAIQAAAQTGQVEIAEILLEAGAPLDICTASMLGRIETVSEMLKADPASVDARGAHNLGVLYHAAVRGHTAIAELLLEKGADINAGRDGNTALHGAITFGQTEMVAWLVAHGADVDVPDYQGLTPLALAQKLGKSEIISLLERHVTAR